MANHIGKSPDEVFEGKQVVVYGPPFVGKTSSLADPNVRVLLCDMDHNTSPLDNADNVDIFPVDSFEEYIEFKESVHRGHFVINAKKVDIANQGYDIVAFDGFTRYEELIKSYVPRVYAPARAREIKGKFGALTDWDDLQTREVQEVRDWQAMTRTHGFCSIWFGHDMAVLNDVTKQAQRIQLALQGKFAAPRIMSAVDALFYMSKEVVKGKEGSPDKIVRGVYTQQEGMIMADARMPIAKREALPRYIPTVEWSKILPYLGYKKKNK